ncbi:Blue-sensitive opsin [Holothuria leucospilota]|uniref:Blue-sensitive opsin n=1 Tax=Holothuria leucospilota TaxID=206669 RepID=A0A9Q1C6V4_HOLLE|nr:Blue-sensitive opsin [Holothuria leucospilota]
MALCKEQREWSANYSLKEHVDYHRHLILFGIEVLFLFFVTVLGLVANVSVGVAILRVPSLRRNLNNILVINLIVMDLCSVFGSMPLSFYDLFNEGYLLCFPLLCRIHGIFASLSTFGNFSAVVLIAVFRCIIIVGGQKITMKKQHVMIMLAVGWSCALAMVLPPLIGKDSKSVYTHGTHHCSPSWKSSCGYYSVGIALTYCITIPTMLICYGLIVLTIKRSADHIAEFKRKEHMDVQLTGISQMENNQNDCRIKYNQEEMSSHQDTFQEDSFSLNPCSNAQSSDQISTVDVNPQLRQHPLKSNGGGRVKRKPSRLKLPHYQRYDKKVALSGIALILTTTVCWTPYFIVHACKAQKASHGLEVFTMWLAYLNAALDPIVYTLLNRKIHKAVVQQFRFIAASAVSACSHFK